MRSKSPLLSHSGSNTTFYSSIYPSNLYTRENKIPQNIVPRKNFRTEGMTSIKKTFLFKSYNPSAENNSPFIDGIIPSVVKDRINAIIKRKIQREEGQQVFPHENDKKDQDSKIADIKNNVPENFNTFKKVKLEILETQEEKEKKMSTKDSKINCTPNEMKYKKMQEIHSIINDTNAMNNTDLQNKMKTYRLEQKHPGGKSKYVQEVNPHANLYDDMKFFNKSASCQRIEHMSRLLGLPITEKVSKFNSKNHPEDLFKLTNEGRIKNKMVDLSHFSIFPDYNARKIDVELKKAYAKNNLNIIIGIKDKLEENKKERVEVEKKEIITKEELNEDINVDDLISG